MSSARETAITALYDATVAAVAMLSPAPIVLRSETVPQKLPTGGLVVVQDGETAEETPVLSPLRWQVRHVAQIAIIVPGATPADRATILDDLMKAIADGIAGDRTLGGAVEYVQPESPSFDDIEIDGAAAARAAAIPVSLWFTTATTPLS